MGFKLQVPAAIAPGKKLSTHYIGGPRGTQGMSRLVQKNSTKPGFDSRTDQAVENRYSDCAVPAHRLQYYALSNSTKFQNLGGGGGRGGRGGRGAGGAGGQGAGGCFPLLH